MKAYEARPKQRIQVEADIWIEPDEIITVTPSTKRENTFDVWHRPNAIYLSISSDLFEVVGAISES